MSSNPHTLRPQCQLAEQTIRAPEPTSRYILFGDITHPLTPKPLASASTFPNQKANSYSQPAQPANTEAAAKPGSEKLLSPPRVQQHPLMPFGTKQVPPNRDVWTAVSDWLATSQTFEKPPAPAPIADPVPPQERLGKEYWLEASRSLDLRMEAYSDKSKAPTQSNPGRANPDINGSISKPHLQIRIPKSAEHTPQSQPEASAAFPLLPDTMGPREKQERESERCIDANTSSEVREKPEKHEREQKKQEQFQSVKLNGADEVVKESLKQLEATKLRKADEAARAKEKGAQVEAQKVAKADETVRAKAKKLTADAMARHKNEQDRMKYVEGRAEDIHENLLQCRPFDIDAVRREFSEGEVQYIKRIVRRLGFAKKR